MKPIQLQLTGANTHVSLCTGVRVGQLETVACRALVWESRAFFPEANL